jgi:3',5'-cyclic AMP phosphodiesterase CpdA
MKIAHFSDLHLLGEGPVPALRLANKRIMGWLNLRYRRSHIHRAAYVRAVAREAGRAGVDHVVVTGDLTNLALEGEFERARDVLERDLGFDPAHVTIVPGNHDVYTRGAMAGRRFEAYFARWLQGDLPELAVDTHGGRFPIVKLRGPVAIVGLSSAVPRPPLVSAGEIGRAQAEALARVLDHPEVARRVVVVAVHHPVVHPWSPAKTYLEGLRDAPLVLASLRSVASGMVLHGHLHRRIQRVIRTDHGQIRQIGATSASLHHEAPDRMAGFNVYELGEAGTIRVEARVYSPDADSFHPESVPRHV